MSGQDGAQHATQQHATGQRETGQRETGQRETEQRGTAPDGRLSHVDESGTARMVDVSGKDVTARTAVARGTLRTTAEVIGLLTAGELPKGDALATARIAGVMGAKRTSELIPLCHQIALSKVDLDFDPGPDHVVITATARTSDRTGVEMEALTAVAVAGLTLHDMVKAVDPAAALDEVRLMAKDGGNSGAWRREENR
ncbi:cyclic pyranopterin monophosphate synthase MoaC [Saccharomonospora halophila]|uniref:cyclic pyranopterin monophosphate synthase MoaC n=1 Tax=Saccharomonospora halophila TaxID=129922 RepID=UPI00037E400C|nr:cyclic pyranopterin monophosphate synthase MoaC [Saccharomonospora halophila]